MSNVTDLKAAKRRDCLARSAHSWSMALAMFPLRVAGCANDLRKLTEMKAQSPAGGTGSFPEAIAHLERVIAEAFLQEFGQELKRPCEETNEKEPSRS